MTFPTVPTAAAGTIISGTQADTTSTRTFPNLSGLTGDAAGNLLIAICFIYDGNSTNAEFSSWGGGFTEFGDFASTATLSIGCAYKWSSGSESGTFTVASTASQTGHAAMIVMSIAAAHATTPPEAGGYGSGTNANADPASLGPSWGADDTLWVAVGGCGETSLTGSFLAMNSAPTNYTDYLGSGASADVIGALGGAVAFRQLNAASEDPGTFGNDASNTRWGAITIAVRPTPGAINGSATISGAGTLSADGVVTGSATLTGAGTVSAIGAATYWRANGNHYDSASAGVTNSGTLTAPTGVVATDHVLVEFAWVTNATNETPPAVSMVTDTGSGTWSTLVAARSTNNMGWALFDGTGLVAGDTFHVHLDSARLITVGHSYWRIGFGTVGSITERGGTTSFTTTAAAITTTENNQEVLVVSVERTPTAGTTVSADAGTQLDYYEGGGTSTCSVYVGSFAGPTSPGSTSAVTITYSHSSGNGGALQLPLVTTSGPVTGSATLTGAGSVSSSGVVTGSASLTGVGTLSATGTPIVTGSATIAGTGALSAAGVVTGAASLTAAGTLTASAQVVGTVTGSATIAGTGTLAAAGTVTNYGAATLTGAGTLTASGAAGVPGTATLIGAGSLTATGTNAAAAVMAGAGTLSASGTVFGTVNGAAVLTGAGTLTANGVRTAAASLTGAGTLSATSRIVGVANLTGAGTLSATGVYTAHGAADLTSVGVLTASGGEIPLYVRGIAAIGEPATPTAAVGAVAAAIAEPGDARVPTAVGG